MSYQKQLNSSNKKFDANMAEERIFSLKRNSKLLFVSAYEPIQTKDFLDMTINEAMKIDCSMVLHAGFSYRKSKNETTEDVLKRISDSIKGTSIETYFAEISGTASWRSKIWNYYSISQNGKDLSYSKCSKQHFSRSSEKTKIREFMRAFDEIGKNDNGQKDEHPIIFLVCGENNIFNRENREYKISKIKSESQSDKFLSNLYRIQKKQWYVFNPSHVAYSGKNLQKHVADFHRSTSKDRRIKGIITGTNPKDIVKSKTINRPVVWKNGDPTEMKLVYKDIHNGIYMHTAQI